MAQDETGSTLYSTAEIMLATGLPRGTITNRAKKFGFDRTGMGYTAEQVLAIITMPMQIHRKSESMAVELRETLNEMLKQLDMPMAIVPKGDGEYMVEYWRRGKLVQEGQTERRAT